MPKPRLTPDERRENKSSFRRAWWMANKGGLYLTGMLIGGLLAIWLLTTVANILLDNVK